MDEIREPFGKLLISEVLVLIRLYDQGWTPGAVLGNQRRLERLRDWGYICHYQEPDGRRRHFFRLSESAEALIRLHQVPLAIELIAWLRKGGTQYTSVKQLLPYLS